MTKRIRIPESIEKAEDRLAALNGIATATGWERAAIVYAFTYDTVGGRPKNGNPTDTRRVSLGTFTRLKIAGLRTQETVAHYRNCWKAAIANGEAQDIQPGDNVVMPSSDFPPQEQNQGSRVSADPVKAVHQVIAKHGADVAADVLAEAAPRAVGRTVARPRVAAEVVNNHDATRQVHQQSSRRTREVIEQRKAMMRANPDAAAGAAAVADAAGAARASFPSAAPEYTRITLHRAGMIKAWINAIKGRRLEDIDRQFLGADFPSLMRLVEEIRVFLEATGDPYEAVAKCRAEREQQFDLDNDLAEMGTDFSTLITEIEKYANEGGA